jgi:hypothetical protein
MYGIVRGFDSHDALNVFRRETFGSAGAAFDRDAM